MADPSRISALLHCEKIGECTQLQVYDFWAKIRSIWTPSILIVLLLFITPQVSPRRIRSSNDDWSGGIVCEGIEVMFWIWFRWGGLFLVVLLHICMYIEVLWSSLQYNSHYKRRRGYAQGVKCFGSWRLSKYWLSNANLMIGKFLG